MCQMAGLGAHGYAAAAVDAGAATWRVACCRGSAAVLPAVAGPHCHEWIAGCWRVVCAPRGAAPRGGSWHRNHQRGTGHAAGWRAHVGGITNAVLATLPAGVLTLDVSNCQRLTPDVTFHHLGALVALRANGTSVSDETLMTGMPPSVVLLGIGCCRNVTAAATCAVLPALRQLDVSKTAVGVDMLTSLPVGLRDLDVSYCSNIDATARLSHLPNLRAISCSVTGISDTTIASCPPTLRYLRADGCRALTDALDLAHLPELAALDVTSSSIGDGMLGRLPLSLQRLELAGTKLTPAAALPPLPRLTCIIAYRTAVGATFLASLPPTVAHLNVEWCCNMRVSDAVAAWQSLVDSDTLDRLAECRVCDGDCPPRVAAMLKVRGVCFGSSSSHTCAAPFPTLLRPEWRRRVDDPFAPWIDDDVCSDDAKDAQP